MKKKKWAVDRNKQVSYLIDFIRKYIKCDSSESLVGIFIASTINSLASLLGPIKIHPFKGALISLFLLMRAIARARIHTRMRRIMSAKNRSHEIVIFVDFLKYFQ